MKSIKNESGAITILVLVSVLFMVSFLISSYVIVANKVQTQKEIVAQTKDIYENYNMDEIYNSYFSSENIIPIYTVEQLLTIGNSEEKTVNINGKYYKFPASKEETEEEVEEQEEGIIEKSPIIYLLMNDLEFNEEEYVDEYINVFDENSNWIPISQNTKIIGNFEGNGHEIKIIDSEGTTKHVYSEKNQYGGNCKLNITVTPEDSSINLIVNQEEIEFKNPTLVPYNSEITYSISKEGYIDKIETITIKENTSIEVELDINLEPYGMITP